jgi:hypothetical protein
MRSFGWYHTRTITRTALIIISGLVFGGFFSACSQTVPSEPSAVQQALGETATPPAPSGFLGNDSAKLAPGPQGKAALIYINSSAQWTKYNKIMLEPVEFWDAGDSGVSPSDQHMLTAYFYNVLKEDLQKHFTLVDQGGPGVMILQVALTNASAATPVLRSVSVVIPQARILNGVQSLATGSYAFVGSAQAEMKATDAETGDLLAAAVDKREGGMAVSSAAQWKWGDAENAMNFWAERVATRLLEMQGRSVAAK